jgi:hypothetical protein
MLAKTIADLNRKNKEMENRMNYMAKRYDKLYN